MRRRCPQIRPRFACFHDLYAKGNTGFTLLGKSGLKRRPFLLLRPQADGANRFTDRTQKPDGAFRDDDVDSTVAQGEPEQSVGGECGNRVDASAEAGAQMIGVQRDRGFDDELPSLCATTRTPIARVMGIC